MAELEEVASSIQETEKVAESFLESLREKRRDGGEAPDGRRAKHG